MFPESVADASFKPVQPQVHQATSAPRQPDGELQSGHSLINFVGFSSADCFQEKGSRQHVCLHEIDLAW